MILEGAGGGKVVISMKDVVPVTIVTGFLGSGKSTLIRRILNDDHGYRVVVVENEFGDDVSIESTIVRSNRNDGGNKSSLSEIIELPNGCMCCSAQDELVRALSELVETRRAQFDYIVVETSGLADPGVVAGMFWVDEALESMLKLDGIVSVVDARNFSGRLGEGGKMADLAEKQVVIGDVVLVNKWDMRKGGEGIVEMIKRINSTARVVVCEYCNVDVGGMLNIGAYDSRRLSGEVIRHQDHIENDVGSITIEFGPDKSFKAAKLDKAFASLVWDENDDDSNQEIWRIKALVNVQGCKDKVIYQAVGDLFDSEETGIPWAEGESRSSRVVFIGKNLTKSVLTSALEEAVADYLFVLVCISTSRQITERGWVLAPRPICLLFKQQVAFAAKKRPTTNKHTSVLRVTC